MKARERAARPGPLIVTNFTINPIDVCALGQIVPLAAGLGVDLQQFIHPFFNSAANADRQNRLLSAKRAHARGLEIRGPSLPPGEYYVCETSARDVAAIRRGLRTAQRQAAGRRIRVKVRPNLHADLLGPYYRDLGYPFCGFCHAMWQKARIMPDGTFSPCMHIVFGNIRDRPLGEMWQGPAMGRWRRIVSKRLFPACVRCCNRGFGAPRDGRALRG